MALSHEREEEYVKLNTFATHGDDNEDRVHKDLGKKTRVKILVSSVWC